VGLRSCILFSASGTPLMPLLWTIESFWTRGPRETPAQIREETLHHFFERKLGLGEARVLISSRSLNLAIGLNFFHVLVDSSPTRDPRSNSRGDRGGGTAPNERPLSVGGNASGTTLGGSISSSFSRGMEGALIMKAQHRPEIWQFYLNGSTPSPRPGQYYFSLQFAI